MDETPKFYCERDDGDTSTTPLNVIRGIVCSIGVFGNMVVIFVIIVLREYKKTVTNWYALQLAVADIFFLLTIPFEMQEENLGEWTLSNSACKAKEALLFINYYSSVLILTVMSIDRYVAVCHGFSSILQKMRSTSKSRVITILIWILSFLFSVPLMLYSGKYECKCMYVFPSQNLAKLCEMEGLSNEDCQMYMSDLSGSGDFFTKEYDTRYDDENGTVYEMGCSYGMLGTNFKAYIYFNFIIMFVVPCLVMSVCYFLIARRLSKSSAFRRESCTDRSNCDPSHRPRSKSTAVQKSERTRLRVTIVCLLLVILFVICWLPFHVIHLAKMTGIKGSSEHCERLLFISAIIAYMNSAFNPYIYNFIGTRFWRRLRFAAGTVKSRTSSISSEKISLKYRGVKNRNVSVGSNSATAMTKLYEKGKSESSDQTTTKDHACREADDAMTPQ